MSQLWLIQKNKGAAMSHGFLKTILQRYGVYWVAFRNIRRKMDVGVLKLVHVMQESKH
jgi:hypothetical protein